MKRILNACKRILIRGILFSGPILVALVILDRVIDKMKALITPLADRLPYHSLFGIGKAYWAAFLILLTIGFLMGIVARLTLAAKFLDWLENAFLHRLPGYIFMKQMGESMVGMEDKVYKVVMLETEGAWQLAYLVETINESMVAIYIPSVPNPQEGDLFYVSKERIKETNISYKDSIRIINCQGRGSAKFLKDII